MSECSHQEENPHSFGRTMLIMSAAFVFASILCIVAKIGPDFIPGVYLFSFGFGFYFFDKKVKKQ